MVWKRVCLAVIGSMLAFAGAPAVSSAACGNPVACENALPGSPSSAWEVDGSGDSTIQGFATQMSVNPGDTIGFKVKSSTPNYHVNIFRLGYYGGNGARQIASNLTPTNTTAQPACQSFSPTGLVDCGNWSVSLSWTVPSSAVSGVYVANLQRNDTGGQSQVIFVVRDDSSHSDVVVSTSDATWQAYNTYGGNSLYQCTTSACPGAPEPKAYKAAFKVSYNRPLQTEYETALFTGAEYSMIRFVEANGYDVSYVSSADVASRGAKLLNHKLFISSGHDEYWSGSQRASLEAARDAGVSEAFFSGNEGFWKTRWEASADGSNTADRTLVAYKDTHFDQPMDPVTWTGTWRDPRFTTSSVNTPENALTGQYFMVNSGTSRITVPYAYRQLRLWRNTAVTALGAGQSLSLAPNTLGYEWDLDVDNGYRPAGQFDLSSTTSGGAELFTDYGSSTQFNQTATHNLTMYRAPSGARVFGAGTVQWAWGLSDWPKNTADRNMQQATMNLFADMGAQPASPQSGLVATPASSDATAPSTTITSPATGDARADGTRITISGSASDSGGVVAGVEVSADGGRSWHPATGTTSWSYSWVVHGAPTATLMARAVDDSGNLEPSPASVRLDVGCPCSMMGAGVTPSVVDGGDVAAIEVGVKFKADLDGTITGIRFYKSAGNTGTHVGNLWTTSGTLRATGTFTGETATGWQQLTFATPVNITAGTTYVASYYAPKGHYSADTPFYTPSPAGGQIPDSSPLHPISANNGGANGIYKYSSGSTFPTNTFNGDNYGVDVSFIPALPPGPASNVAATPGPGSATVTWTAPVTGGTPTSYIVTPYIGSAPQPATTVTGAPPATSAVVRNLSTGVSYTFKVQAANGSGTSAQSAASNAVTPNAPTAPGAPTGVVATAQNQQAAVRWTAPGDGGRTITAYTVTPFLGGVAQPGTTVTGSPAPNSAVVPNLVNGSAYTFAVTATNAVGDGPQSAQSAAVTPSGVPRFVQQVSGRIESLSLPLTPSSAITAGDRLVVMAGAWSSASATISAVTDSAGNTYTKVASVAASDFTQLSVWTAPITAGDGTKPTIAITATSGADIGGAVLEYAGLSSAAGSAAVDQLKTATGTSSASGFVTSGATPALTGDNELAMGFYADSGFSRTLAADPTFTQRVNVSPTPDMEFVVEDAPAAAGSTPAARVSTGANTPWLMATVAFKRAAGASAPALSVSPASLSFGGTAGGPSPAAKTLSVSNAGGGTLNWTASESASWLSLAPTSGTDSGTITATADITGLSAGTYTADITLTAPGAGGSPKTVPVTFTVAAPTPPVLAVTPASLSFSATQGGANPAAKSLTVANTGGGTMNWTASDDAPWLTVSPASGTNGGAVSVTPSITGLAAGTYSATVTVDAGTATGSPVSVPVTLTVAAPPPPALALTPTTMSFSATQGSTNPAAQTASVTNSGSGSLDVSAADDAAWLSVTPATATAPATLSVRPDITGLAAGTYTATVTVTATTSGATGSPKTIAVTLSVGPPASSGLVGAWGFNEASGTAVGDASGSGNAGTITNATRTTTGKFGGALSFNGTNAWVTVPDSASLDLASGMTMEAWVNPTAVGTAWRTVALKEQAADLVYALYAGNGKGKAATDVFTNANKEITGTTNTPLNTWTHLAATYDGATQRLYVNGVQVASKAATGAIKTSTGALRIGGNSVWGEYFAGQIDEMRIYNKALTAAQIQADMTAPV